MTADRSSWLKDLIGEFVRNSPKNRLKPDSDERAWEDVLVGFASGADPIFDRYKDLVGEFHWTPLEIFRLTFPSAEVSAKELTVISWILPQRKITRDDNRAESRYPSERWIQARFAGEDFNEKLRRHVEVELNRIDVEAVAPVLAPDWTREKSQKFVFASKWSERHAAYAAGLGTFGLCDGLITAKGKAHRVGSVVANLIVPPTPRPYSDHHEYCLYFREGTCKACTKRCPVDAISEDGHDKIKCRNHVRVTCGEYVKENYGFAGYGCGLCQTGVPCEAGIPKKLLKKS
jgi:epoxyqueuosine reductase